MAGRDLFVSMALLMVALPVRLYNLQEPPEVVFDEVHFGSFANHYINRTFYFDVHPPLAKMLIALIGYLCGYNGQFGFETIGKSYVDSGVPFVQMRAVSGFLGACLVPMAFITLRDGGHSMLAALLASLVVLFENSLVTNSRFILLDPYLLAFGAWTLMAWNKVFKKRNRPFTIAWYFWLVSTGIGLGCSVSCKWVGLFMIATIGCSTVTRLWDVWGDLRVTTAIFLKHVLAYFACLFVLPVMIYVSCFYAHLTLLSNTGPGDSHMSSYFQHTLAGRELDDSPLDVFYGSVVSIRHLGTHGGYLHSHLANYPEGSQQQQVTLYPYDDDNNWWRILKMNDTKSDDVEKQGVLGSDNKTWLEYVQQGDVIRLEHVATSPKKLHSHNEKPPLSDSESYKEVSAYGFVDYDGDANDFWTVAIHEANEGAKLQTLQSRFELVHALQACSLYSGTKQLPDWGFGQQEVACVQSGKVEKTTWIIEQTRHDLLPPGSSKMVNYPQQTFWFKMKELHQVMWAANNELTEHHPYQSRPSEWPMLVHGISYWAKDTLHIYFLGNPLVYWTITVIVFVYMILTAFFMIRQKRGIQERFQPEKFQFYQKAARFYVMAWAFHYLPFFIMKRQLFLHHYLPALYCGILLFGVSVDLIMQKWTSPVPQRAFASLCLVAVVCSFYTFASLSYALPWNQQACVAAQWLPLWDFGCDR
ncbi:Dolichyl-phosphate-mannose-protein mannosyltransferase-domain-containing protein [Gongronella butleri]|nr:Dolichyl-phosphate-mannose-protein mannosyltransferase-domain-containing protein [Gongronella butleri]